MSPSVKAIVLAAAAMGCRAAPPPAARWEVGYWYWRPSVPNTAFARSDVTPDVLYVQVGTLSSTAPGDSRWPAVLPPAGTYVAAWRSDEPRAPDAALAPLLAESYARLQASAARAGQRIAGIQVDVDCPTASLPAYAAFLRRLRAAIGPRSGLSITALLDWFRPGTGLREVLAAVDEYVPQFYDTHPSGLADRIAEPVDVERWAPRFNALGRPYRVGVSIFGRVQRVRPRSQGGPGRAAFRDVTLRDLWSGGFRLADVRMNGAGERLLGWEIAGPPPPGTRLGDGIEVVLPTPASVRSATTAARRLGPLCGGVVYFRWPGDTETLALTPDEVAACLSPQRAGGRAEVRVADGRCAPRSCADVAVRPAERFASRPTRLRLWTSTAVDYLVASQAAVRVEQTGPRAIEVTVPPFFGEREVLVGRVFCARPARFQVQRGPS